MDAFAQGLSWCYCGSAFDSSNDNAFRSNRCCGSNIPGGPLDSDKFEREAHREISELKERSRIRQLEAEQRQLQRGQPGPTEEMTTNPGQKL